ncbi:4946_t:CDS:2 [Cetraspora pellucida]|uniref:4946_t:CDS:1 n=1 Tax=Cetraspora pellucida TaxID=1433469 RepID=A0ACA9LAB5_9GLOM|nr:4946_t:CDS:2 [Cetraspora pellucida]
MSGRILEISPSSWVDKKSINLYEDGPEKSQELTKKKLFCSTFQKKDDGLYFRFNGEPFEHNNLIRNKVSDTWEIGEFKFQLKYERDVLSEDAG